MGMLVLVADDHPLYREAVARQITRLLPDAMVVEAASMEEALVKANATRPEFLVFDYCMPGMSADAIARVARKFPDVPILVLYSGAGPSEVRAILQAGVRGVLPKTATPDQLTHAIHLLLAGGTSVPPEILLPGAPEGAPPWLAVLTPRETDVLRAAARGLSNKEIARELDLAEITVKLHLSAIFRKMGVRSRTKAAMMATKSGAL
jgi:DNA-binding NarL/FixJ family response regulator